MGGETYIGVADREGREVQTVVSSFWACDSVRPRYVTGYLNLHESRHQSESTAHLVQSSVTLCGFILHIFGIVHSTAAFVQSAPCRVLGSHGAAESTEAQLLRSFPT